jgi:hypothetical protein
MHDENEKIAQGCTSVYVCAHAHAHAHTLAHKSARTTRTHTHTHDNVYAYIMVHTAVAATTAARLGRELRCRVCGARVATRRAWLRLICAPRTRSAWASSEAGVASVEGRSGKAEEGRDERGRGREKDDAPLLLHHHPETLDQRPWTLDPGP